MSIMQCKASEVTSTDLLEEFSRLQTALAEARRLGLGGVVINGLADQLALAERAIAELEFSDDEQDEPFLLDGWWPSDNPVGAVRQPVRMRNIGV